MKNLKKVLALVVVFSMMLCSVAFAAFPDVAEDADYANAVNTLAALDIIGGDDQGNFNPDNTITRAEFTKIVCEMQGLKGDANKGATQFSDVAADHWASGYINMATNMGIINGMGDGTFAPSSPVTYEQAIKMIVVALGYEPMAAEKGGYPTGYLVVAQSTGITKGIKAPAQADPAVRSLIAELVCKALDIPLMERVSYGSDAKYEIKDGTEGSRVTLLTSKFDVVKLGGVVIANEKQDLDGIDLNNNMTTDINSSSKEGHVTIAYDDNYNSTNKDFELTTADGKNVTRAIVAKVGESKADEFFGKRVEAYVKEVGSSYEVIAIVLADGKNDTIKVDFADIDAGAKFVTTPGSEVFAYYASDDARKAEEIDAANAVVIWNKKVHGARDFAYIKANAATTDAEATLVDWNADDNYDLIIVEEYAHYVVSEIDADIATIDTLSGDSFKLESDDEDVEIAIVDVDGNEVAFEDIKVDDVIAVMSDNVAAPESYTNFIEVVVLGESAVEGKVVAYDAENAVITVEGEQYEVATGCYNGANVDLSAEGTFYLGLAGKVIAFEGSKAAGNYAIILEAGESGGSFNKGYQFKVLTKEGKVEIYNLADDVIFRNGLTSGNRQINVNTATFAADHFDNTAWAGFNGLPVVDQTDPDTSLMDQFTAVNAAGLESNINTRLVQIKVNSNNEITEITPSGTATFEIGAKLTDAEYNENTAKFGAGSSAVRVEEATVLFSINKNDVEKSKVVTLNTLIDDAPYTLYGVDKDNVSLKYGAAVILDGGDSLAGSANGMAVVLSKSTTQDANGDDAIALEVVANGSEEVAKILVNADTEVDGTYNASNNAYALANAMGTGSLMLYSADEAGNALVIASIANYNATDKDYDFVLKNGVDATYEAGGKDITFVYGVTTGKLASEFATTDGEIFVPGSAYKYRLDNSGRKLTVEVGAFKGGNVVTAASGMGNLVLARKVDDEVIDIISIDSRISTSTSVAAADIRYFGDDPLVVNPGDACAAATTFFGLDCEDNSIVVVLKDRLPAGSYNVKVSDGTETAVKNFTAPAAGWGKFAMNFNAGGYANWTTPATFCNSTELPAGEYTATVETAAGVVLAETIFEVE